jgi:hypothetical protein
MWSWYIRELEEVFSKGIVEEVDECIHIRKGDSLAQWGKEKSWLGWRVVVFRK